MIEAEENDDLSININHKPFDGDFQYIKSPKRYSF